VGVDRVGRRLAGPDFEPGAGAGFDGVIEARRGSAISPAWWGANSSIASPARGPKEAKAVRRRGSAKRARPCWKGGEDQALG